MVKMVPAVVYDNEPHVVRRDSEFLSAGILSEGISFAIAISHCDCLKRTDPLTGRRLEHEIDGYVEMPQQSFAPMLANLIELLNKRGYCWARWLL